MNDWARAGLMIRESLDPGARHLTLWVTKSRGLVVQWRPTGDGFPAPEVTAVTNAALRLPITFDPPLASMLHLGLAITAAHRSAITQARFSLPEVKKL